LSHTRWDCKYHVVFIPKKRKKVIYGSLRKYLGEILHELAKEKGIKIEEGHLMKDHIHMCLSVPPKFAVSNVVGYLKGKSAIAIARQLHFGLTQKRFGVHYPNAHYQHHTNIPIWNRLFSCVPPHFINFIATTDRTI